MYQLERFQNSTRKSAFAEAPPRRHRSQAQFGPCPLRVLPGRVVYDWWPSRHRTHVIHTVRTPVVLQVGVFERSIVGSPRAVPYTVSGLSGETCWWNSLLRNRESIAMSGDAILAHRNNSDHPDRRNGSVNEVTGCMHTLLRPAEPPTARPMPWWWRRAIRAVVPVKAQC